MRRKAITDLKRARAYSQLVIPIEVMPLLLYLRKRAYRGQLTLPYAIFWYAMAKLPQHIRFYNRSCDCSNFVHRGYTFTCSKEKY